MKKSLKIIVFAGLVLSSSLLNFAQSNSRKSPAKKNAEPSAAKSVNDEKAVAIPAPTPETKLTHKKNERPGNNANSEKIVDEKAPETTVSPAGNGKFDAYYYEFSQPNFTLSQIVIAHDEKGKGTISFLKKGVEESVSDPLQLSPATLEKINNSLAALDFINSSESYQFEKDYSHLGNIKIRVKKDGREREAKFNYTTVQDAKNLADEYRRISQQYVWIFDINLARENQPLESPKLFDSLDSLIRRNEIADPQQLITFLKELSNDERMPLISRNHATRLVKQIEKKQESNK